MQTASNAEYNSDTRAKNHINIINVTHDLERTRKVEFHDILEMFIKRRELGTVPNPKLLEEVVKERGTKFDEEFERELQEAVDFCNMAPCPDTFTLKGTPNEELCRKMKWCLKEYCSQSLEKSRYTPFANFLNYILRWMDQEPEFIFVVNDPVIVQLRDKIAPKRKLDILLVKVETFKSWYENCEDFCFEDCQTLIAKKLPRKKDAKPSWSDIIQFWELGYKKSLGVKGLLSEEFIVDDMRRFSSNQAREPSSTVSASKKSGINRGQPSAMNGKRKSEENTSTPNKRSRSNQTSSAHTSLSTNLAWQRQTASGALAPPLKIIPSVSKDVQCAYYAIEGLRSSWEVSHFSGILLQDTALNVLWYDAQGCLMSHPLDIVKYLPLLLVLVKVQVCSNYLSGCRRVDVIPKPYNSYELGKFAGPLFQLVGRRTCHAFLTSSRDDKSSAADEYFFKVSWPEDTCDKEHDIIKDTQKRVELLLPQHRGYVLNHLPDIKDSGVVPDMCTAIIRMLTNCLLEAMEGSRSKYWIILKKLWSLASVVHHSDKFKKIYIELIRCHCLLWTIGIAHCDISFNNLMYDEGSEGLRGILNDFDLAAKMEPGNLSPPKTGFRRTGTKIFMALRLLRQDAVYGEVPRLYQHDLESFAWVLLYACICVDSNGQECFDKEPIHDWLQADHVSVGEKKLDFLMHFTQFLRTNSGSHGRPLWKSLWVWRQQSICISAVDTADAADAFDAFELKSLLNDPTSQVPLTVVALLYGVLEAWGWTKEEHDWVLFVVEQSDKSQAG